MTMFLTKDELKELTGHVRAHAQAKELDKMGIEYKPRGDGSLAVLRSHVEKEFGLLQQKPANKKSFQPNWEALNNDALPA